MVGKGELKILKEFMDIPDYQTWEKIEVINKGWSTDKKFYVETVSGEKYLLRVSEKDTYNSKLLEYQQMCRLTREGLPISTPIGFGKCSNDELVYGLFLWTDGDAMDEVIQDISAEEQYNLGIEAGKILKKFHRITITNNGEDIRKKWEKKYHKWLKRYNDGKIKFPKDLKAMKYIEENIEILDILDSSLLHFLHGDFHLGNMVLNSEGHITIIDFNRWDYGNIYEDFIKNFWFSRELSYSFSKGQIQGYFSDKVPDTFFKIILLFLAREFFIAIPWAEKLGHNQIEGMQKRINMITEDFSDFNEEIPVWWKENNK